MSGEVVALGALASAGWRENYYIRSVPIKVLISEPDPRVIPDLSVYADVEVSSRDNALLVPRSAVEYENEQAFVVKQTAKGFERVPVQVELTNATLAAVSGGVSEGDQVLSNPTLLSSR
jgi:HlyD family secretion protein